MTMVYVCPVCGKKLERELMSVTKHMEEHIVEAIKKKHPEWVDADGTCDRCYSYFKDQMSGRGRQ